MKKNLIILAAALVCGFSAAAQDYNWDKPDKICNVVECLISGRDTEPKVALDPILTGDKKPVNCRVRNEDITWQNKEEMRAFSLYVTTPQLKENEWITCTFSFKIRSRKKGRIKIVLRPFGNWCHTGKGLPDVVFMGVAQISSPQISFPNGGYFGTANLKPWCYKDKITDKNLMPVVGVDDALTTPGKKFLRVCQPLVHYVDVKPGQEFTISFTVKPMEYFVPLR